MLKRKPKKLYCCERCQNYWTCETKWYRGEHNEESVCCSLCTFYEACWKDKPSPLKKVSRKVKKS